MMNSYHSQILSYTFKYFFWIFSFFSELMDTKKNFLKQNTWDDENWEWTDDDF